VSPWIFQTFPLRGKRRRKPGAGHYPRTVLELWRLSAGELADGYARRSFSPAEVVESVLARIGRVNESLTAIVTLDVAGARMQARASEERWRGGAARGPLDGVPITVKDNIPVAGLRSTWGSRLYAEFVPAVDELPVARLRAAGAVVLGKTNVPEFTLQGYTDNLLFGVTRNPWDPALTPGGSSGGAVAAVASGLGPVAIATDGAGSIRRPASHAGLVGFKPSRGRVPRCDGFPAILLDFETIGPIARTVGDVVRVMQAMSAADARDPSSLPFADREFVVPDPVPTQRILYAATFGGAAVDPEIEASVAAAARNLARLGHSVDEVAELNLADAMNEAWPTIAPVGVAWLLGGHRDWRGRVGAPLEQMADAGAIMSATRFFDALNTAATLRYELGKLFSEYDLLLTPSAAALPWAAGEPHPTRIAGREVGPRGHAVFTVLANATGCPAISVPCTPSAAGLPIGFQLVAPIASDELLCALALQYEREHPWAHRWPARFDETAFA
jgi:aspartyl-tRNA(Asn)/glutamyl-tRNA(Gln) amidotransferase subunit A